MKEQDDKVKEWVQVIFSEISFRIIWALFMIQIRVFWLIGYDLGFSVRNGFV